MALLSFNVLSAAFFVLFIVYTQRLLTQADKKQHIHAKVLEAAASFLPWT